MHKTFILPYLNIPLHIKHSLLFLFFLSKLLPAQDLLVNENHLGFNAGVCLGFGTHFQRLGLNLNFYYLNDHVQVNTELRAYYNFRSLGPRGRYSELVVSEGLVYAYGNKRNFFNPFLSSVSNQTTYEHSVGYSYNVYLNKRNTSQFTGLLALQFRDIRFVTENDLLARPMHDRFRTAALLLQYQYQDLYQAGLNCTLWTGKMGFKTVNDRFPNNCYMDTVPGVYPNSSHGLLSLQFNYHPGYSQNLQASAGVDAEQVRNTVQNKFIHDLPFLPKKWNKNCHIPMIDSEGKQYLYLENQKIRKPKLFLNLYSNAGLFY